MDRHSATVGSPALSSLLRPWYRTYRSIKYGISLPYYRILDRFQLSNPSDIYTEEYFNKRAEEPYDNATKAAVEVLDERFDPSSVFDVGCAIGVYLHYFEERGADVAGIEGAEIAVENAIVDSIRHADLRDSPRVDSTHDLILCLEVAEHLHPIYAEGLVDTIESAAHEKSTIIFTAADIGQYGTYHLNLQPHQYWIDKFRNRGWKHDDQSSVRLAAEIKSNSENPLIMSDNIMVFIKE